MVPRYFYRLVFVLSSVSLLNNYVDGAMTMQQMETAATGLRNVCLSKTGADPEIVAGLRKGQYPEDEKFQCYLKCVMGLLKSMKNGRPVLEPIIKQITLMMPIENQERSIVASKTCASTLDFNDNACIAAWQFVRCQYEMDPEVFFFP